MNNMIIKLEDVDKFYMETGNKLHILKKLNLEVKRGEFVSILGKSGSGKSTLLNIMGLLDKIDGGKIWIDDKEVSSLNETERNNIKKAPTRLHGCLLLYIQYGNLYGGSNESFTDSSSSCAFFERK